MCFIRAGHLYTGGLELNVTGGFKTPVFILLEGSRKSGNVSHCAIVLSVMNLVLERVLKSLHTHI